MLQSIFSVVFWYNRCIDRIQYIYRWDKLWRITQNKMNILSTRNHERLKNLLASYSWCYHTKNKSVLYSSCNKQSERSMVNSTSVSSVEYFGITFRRIPNEYSFNPWFTSVVMPSFFVSEMERRITFGILTGESSLTTVFEGIPSPLSR